MKKLCVWVCVGVLLIAGCGHKGGKKAIRPLTMMEKMSRPGASDRERVNCLGPVREERCTKVILQVKAGRAIEVGWKQMSTTRYRPNGKFAEMIVRNSPSHDMDGRYSRVVNEWDAAGKINVQRSYGRDGKLNEKTVHRSDDRGNSVETRCYWPNGSLQCRYLYRYDGDGRRTGMTTYLSDGSVYQRQATRYEARGAERTSTYGADGKLVSESVSKPLAQGNGYEAVFRDANGKLKERDICRFDAHWNRIEFVSRKPDGSLMSKRTWANDAKGNVLVHTDWNDGSIKWNRDGSARLKETKEYTFDATGNWTRRMTYRQVTINGKSKMQPYEVDYRTIAYY
ncbi:MAG: hypothetical protein Q7T82_10305 [Armatimonadota bacterium]|nr:hypothetical protein [Armatimonadota bacterium]